MQSFIKKIVLGLALFTAFGLTSYAQAAAQFGAGNSPYLPLVQAQVCGLNGNGCNSNPSAYTTSISGVQPGDNVWIMLYYNNIGNVTATNTRFTLSPQSTGVVTSQNFSGTLSASNASPVSGQASVNLTQGQTLTFLSAKLYAHNGVQIPLPYGQNGTELFSSGLNIGNIEGPQNCPNSDTFCHQGVVIVTYKVSQTVVVPQQCQITQFNVSPTSVISGGSSTLTWNTTGCTTVSVNGTNISSSAFNGSQSTGALYNNATYVISASSNNGMAPSQQVTVSVAPVIVPPPQQCYINYFTASPTYVTSGSSSTLSWSTSGCTSAYVSGTNVSSNTLSGSTSTGSLYTTTSYTLNAYGVNGQVTPQTVTVSVNPIYYPPTQYCSINSFYASPTSVTSGGSSTLYWSTTGATSVSISGLNNNYGNYLALSGSQSTGALYSSGNYTITAYCSNGQSQTQTIYVSVNQPVQSLSVITTSPSLVSSNSARFNGLLTNSGGYSTNVYFEWGASQNLGNTTNSQNAGSGSSTPFFDTTFNLSSGTTYYYRAVASNTLGVVRGDIQAFSTPTIQVVPPVVIRPVVTSGVGSGSNLVSLKIEDRFQNICVNDIVDYTVSYKNISGKTLENVVLQVLLPKDVEFRNTNPGIYNIADHTVTLPIGTLVANQEGQMYVSGIVLRSAQDRDLIVATANIAFTNPANNSQESATAYALNNTNDCVNRNSLAGLAFWGDGFWPTTLIGWLILILILLALVYLAVRLYDNRRDTRVRSTSTSTTTSHYGDMDIPTYGNGNH